MGTLLSKISLLDILALQDASVPPWSRGAPLWLSLWTTLWRFWWVANQFFTASICAKPFSKFADLLFKKSSICDQNLQNVARFLDFFLQQTAVMVVWTIRERIIKTVLCCIAVKHTHMSSSYKPVCCVFRLSSRKSSINANRKSTTRFPMSLRWSSYVAPKSPKEGLKTQNGRFA